MTGYLQETNSLCNNLICAAYNKQRNTEQSPAHENPSNPKQGIKGIIGMLKHPDKTSFFYLAGLRLYSVQYFVNLQSTYN